MLSYQDKKESRYDIDTEIEMLGRIQFNYSHSVLFDNKMD